MRSQEKKKKKEVYFILQNTSFFPLSKTAMVMYLTYPDCLPSFYTEGLHFMYYNCSNSGSDRKTWSNHYIHDKKQF